MISLAIAAIVMLGLMTILLLKNKVSPVVGFIVFPLTVAFVLVFFTENFSSIGNKGEQIFEVLNWSVGGVRLTMNNSILFMFSIIYFGIMNDVGLFDPIINILVKHAGKNTIFIYLATAAIALLGQLDGATATTYLVTIPVMLPIYKRMRMNVLQMLTIVGGITGVWNIIPWGGTIIRTATVITNSGIPSTPQGLWKEMIPIQIMGTILVIILAIYFGIKDKKSAVDLQEIETEESVEVHSEKKSEEKTSVLRLSINMVLTISVITFMIVFPKIPSFFVFLIATAFALLINYRTSKEQMEIISKNSPVAFSTAGTFLAAGVFLGIFKDSGMTKALADVFLHVFPSLLLSQIGRILGAFGSGVGIIFSSDLYYYSLLPVIIEAAEKVNINPKNIGLAMLVGQNIGTAISPCIPTTFLAVGLAGVELRDHIKFSLKYFVMMSIVLVSMGVFIGIM